MKSLFAGILLFSIAIYNVFATPVSEYGALKVSGGKVVGTDGKSVQIAGNSLYWTLWGGQKFYNSTVVNQVATNWNASLIRAAIGVENTDGYLELPERHIGFAKTVVDAAIENGIYVIVDWHDHNANQHIAASKEFFTEMAKTYKNTPNVIWEIWNEPDKQNGTGSQGADSWDDIRNYADSIIPVIRQYSSNLIVVGTPNWSSDPAAAAKNPISDPNVAYTLHFYAGTHGSSVRKNAETALDSGLAIFITEFGITDASGGKDDPTLYFDLAKTWLDWADSKGISWANWSLSNIDEAGSVLKVTAAPKGIWTDADLSEAGVWIRDRLLARPKFQSAIRDLPAVRGDSPGTNLYNSPTLKNGTELFWSPVSKATTVSLVDIGGRVMVPATVSNPVSLTTTPKGLYLLLVKDGRQMETFRILK